MMDALASIFFIICCVSYGSPYQWNNRPGNQSILLIGIFSKCNLKNNSIIRDDLYRNAAVCKSSIDWVTENKDFVNNKTQAYHKETNSIYSQYWLGQSNYLDDLRYVSFEVCTQEDAVGLALELVLSKLSN